MIKENGQEETRRPGIAYLSAVLAMLVFVVNGCATTPDAPMSQAEELLRVQTDQMTKTVAQGALGGALVGALIGKLVGQDNRAVAIGAGSGALMGGLGGYYVAKRKETYASEEARVDAIIADIRNDNAQLRGYIATASSVIEADQARIGEIEAQYASRSIDLDTARGKLSRVHENRELIAETLEGLTKKKEEYRYAAQESRVNHPEVGVGRLDSEIDDLENQIAILARDLASLDEALAVSRIG